MKTTGMADVAFLTARLGCGPKATMRSGLSATNSCARPGNRSTCPPAPRVSMCRLLPSTHPAPRSPSRSVSAVRFPSHWVVQSTRDAGHLVRSLRADIGRSRDQAAGDHAKLDAPGGHATGSHRDTSAARAHAESRHCVAAQRRWRLSGMASAPRAGARSGDRSAFRSLRPLGRALAPVCAHRSKSDWLHSAPMFHCRAPLLPSGLACRARPREPSQDTRPRRGRSKRLCRSGPQFHELARGQLPQAAVVGVADAQPLQLVHRLHQVLGARSPVADSAAQHLRDRLATQPATSSGPCGRRRRRSPSDVRGRPWRPPSAAACSAA